MSNSAKVGSVEAISAFRAALVKFAEHAYAALTDCDSEIHRTLMWLENEQKAHWQAQLRQRSELVNRCKEAVRMKKLFKNAAGQYDSAVDEEKALKRAMRQLAEAEEKLAATRRWVPRLQKEIHLYKGLVQRFSTAVQSDVPLAISRLERIVRKLEEYLSLAPEVALESPGMLEDIFKDAASMARGGDERPAEAEEAQGEQPKQQGSSDGPL